jgi:hypothetical protein
MSSRNIIFCVTIRFITSVLTISPAVSIYAQTISSKVAQWFIPLDLGKQLKIKCNGSLVDFVSDCTSPANCKSLRQAGNDILECIPDSKLIDFSITNTRERLTIKSKTYSLNEIIVLR